MKPRSGAALVEIIISILIIAFGVAGVAGTLLISSRAPKQAEDKERAATYLSSLLEELRTYVTADTAHNDDAPEPDWKLHGDACDCWALKAGEHDVSARLDSDFKDKYKAKMAYTVSLVSKNGEDMRQVKAQLDWTPPQ
ncbi:MAG: hypothetical protein PHF00_06920 [Elusimicrobia bacterium]|nr:hypothetical protein [Elusimicrobiota bacterium]